MFRSGRDSIPGLDGWHASDLKYLSDLAIKLLAGLLNSIEKGAPWPNHMFETRAVFLSKDSSRTDDPMAYRVLKITSIFYRKRGSCRMRDLDPWIRKWDLPGIHVCACAW